MKKCHMCTHEIKEEANFCNKCGAKQAEHSHLAANAEELQGQVEMTNNSSNSSEVESQSKIDSREVIEPTKLEQKVAEVATNLSTATTGRIDTVEIKQKANDYWQYFVRTLKCPGDKVSDLPQYYGFIGFAVYGLAVMLFMWGMSGWVLDLPWSGRMMYTDFLPYYDALAGDIVLWSGLIAALSLFISSGVLFITQRYVLRRAVSYIYVVERYASYLAIGSVTLVVAGIILKLSLGITLMAIATLGAVVQMGMIFLVVPILILATEERKGSREWPVFYSVLINGVLHYAVWYVLERLLD
ncbi:zinc ribbon domain-containing protein [Aerococcaceae bacterium NML210727]|nr:zinc ribbon domain-containing protein [Aerococcaceae bacterium NML210727]MCW6654774.1 zinc ribbon domain-containing protein [Aerococcaceae bacterium NML201296]MCW6664803.1 zinc ribbon domain-containing protein [Aerococcaceae bacterium NML191219]MCW6667200.1 zinc ribbon domain-containing protein [Aerococcaceae bacterium NML190938]